MYKEMLIESLKKKLSGRFNHPGPEHTPVTYLKLARQRGEDVETIKHNIKAMVEDYLHERFQNYLSSAIACYNLYEEATFFSQTYEINFMPIAQKYTKLCLEKKMHLIFGFAFGYGVGRYSQEYFVEKIIVLSDILNYDITEQLNDYLVAHEAMSRQYEFLNHTEMSAVVNKYTPIKGARKLNKKFTVRESTRIIFERYDNQLYKEMLDRLPPEVN
jgi:hypothetical protein